MLRASSNDIACFINDTIDKPFEPPLAVQKSRSNSNVIYAGICSNETSQYVGLLVTREKCRPLLATGPAANTESFINSSPANGNNSGRLRWNMDAEFAGFVTRATDVELIATRAKLFCAIEVNLRD